MRGGRRRADDLSVQLLRISNALDESARTAQVDYVFDPDGDMTVKEVIQLLKILRISASSDEYLHHDFPLLLKRHFRPKS